MSRDSRRKAFTLIEVLIVVVIMAILAATIIPQFSSSTQDAMESALKFNILCLGPCADPLAAHPDVAVLLLEFASVSRSPLEKALEEPTDLIHHWGTLRSFLVWNCLDAVRPLHKGGVYLAGDVVGRAGHPLLLWDVCSPANVGFPG